LRETDSFSPIWAEKSFQKRSRTGIHSTTDFVVAGVAVILVLEATRRVAGWPMVIVAVGFLAYALLGNHLPGLFAHRGVSLQRLLEHTYLGLEGIMGIPLGVSATVIATGSAKSVALQRSWYVRLVSMRDSS
jgi:TRAP-type uncharacterized transport system fused permease subunit